MILVSDWRENAHHIDVCRITCGSQRVPPTQAGEPGHVGVGRMEFGLVFDR